MGDLSPVDMQSEVMAAFAAYWAGRTQISSPNDTFDSAKVPPGESFVRWDILGTPEGRQRLSHSVERNHFLNRGVITFTVSSPLRTGESVALGFINDIMLWLEAVVLTTVWFQETSTPLKLGDDGTWHQVSVSAPWVYLADRPSVLA